MSNKLEFWVGNPPQLVGAPDNWQSLELEISFDNNSPEATLNASQLVWKGAEAKLMNDWFNKGLLGGVGIFEGIPLQIKICDPSQVIFNGIIDLTDPSTIFNCDIVKCKIRDKRMDMISQLFDSISFAYLATPVNNGGGGIITPKIIPEGGDYVAIPYQHNDIPDYIQVFSLALAI